MRDFLPPFVIVAGALGALGRKRIAGDRAALFFLTILGAASFFLIASRIATGARQLFPTMIALVILAACAVTIPGGRPRIPMLALALIFLVFQGIEGWQTMHDFRRVDSRAATVDWFIDNAPDGSRVLSQPELYEFGVLNGFSSEKRFSYALGDDLYSQCPDYFVVEDEDGLPPHTHRFWEDVEVVARFAPPDFSGPERLIFSVRDSCDLADAGFLVN